MDRQNYNVVILILFSNLILFSFSRIQAKALRVTWIDEEQGTILTFWTVSLMAFSVTTYDRFPTLGGYDTLYFIFLKKRQLQICNFPVAGKDVRFGS